MMIENGVPLNVDLDTTLTVSQATSAGS